MPEQEQPSATPLSAVEKLSKTHDLAAFDCGNESLNTCLKRFALTNLQSDSAQTFVVHRGGVVAGYYRSTELTHLSPRDKRRLIPGSTTHIS